MSWCLNMASCLHYTVHYQPWFGIKYLIFFHMTGQYCKLVVLMWEDKLYLLLFQEHHYVQKSQYSVPLLITMEYDLWKQCAFPVEELSVFRYIQFQLDTSEYTMFSIFCVWNLECINPISITMALSKITCMSLKYHLGDILSSQRGK